jgi:hypothetical protein
MGEWLLGDEQAEYFVVPQVGAHLWRHQSKNRPHRGDCSHNEPFGFAL